MEVAIYKDRDGRLYFFLKDAAYKTDGLTFVGLWHMSITTAVGEPPTPFEWPK